MLTDRGAAILGSRTVAPAPPLRLTVQPDLQVIVPREASWYDRFLLERFARWVDEGPQSASYRMNAQSIRACLEQGIGSDQILAFLRRASAARVPAPVVRAVRAWSSAVGPGSSKSLPHSGKAV